MQFGILFVFLCAIVGIESIPIINKPCKQNDTACVTKLANDMYKFAVLGDLAMDVEILDPAHQDLIKSALTALEYNLYNTTLLGFKNCVIDNVTLAIDHSQLSLVLRCPKLDMKGDYEIKGEILSIPINGKGPFTLECKDYIVTVEGKMTTYRRKDGKHYLAFKNFKAHGDLIGGWKYHLDNLFDGNKDLEETFYKVVNENWKELSKELQVSVVDTYMKRIVNNLNKIFKTVSLESMFI